MANICELCQGKCAGKSKYCCQKCNQINRLRERALTQLFEAEERNAKSGYTSDVLVSWIKYQVIQIQEGLQDDKMYNMWLNGK